MNPGTPEVKPHEWVLPDRVGFLPWMAETFQYTAADPQTHPQTHTHTRRPKNQHKQNSKSTEHLFAHQRFIRDYLQPASPYRGLVLFHSVGTGKTCSAIAVAAAHAQTKKRVILLAPASLKDTFMQQISMCSEGLLSSNDITFVGYNGLSARRLDEIIKRDFFRDAIIIIDEAHNFITAVLNEGLLKRLYQHIMDAEGSKVIILSGTPLKNDPRELAYMVNLAHGYQWVIEMRLASAPNREHTDRAIDLIDSVDRWDIMDSGRTYVIKLLPPGFKRTSDTRTKGSVVPLPAENQSAMTAAMTSTMLHVQNQLRGISDLNQKNIQFSTGRRLVLPVRPDEFQEMFFPNANDTGLTRSARDALLRRVVGAVSFFSAYDPALFPKTFPIVTFKCAMSARQFAEYEKVREEERLREETARRIASSRMKLGVSGGLSDNSVSIPMASLAVCNFAFPEDVQRPRMPQIRASMLSQTDQIGQSDHDTPEGDAAYPEAKQFNKAYEQALHTAVTSLSSRSDVLTGAGLAEHSPKFAKLLDTLSESKGSAIVYSQFRAVEGIMLLAATLRMNGWRQLALTWDGTNKAFERHDDKGSGKGFMVYENTVPGLGEAIINLFNQPNRMVDLLLISKSGAEGLNLKNVREVHILEPFWHMNRIEQVIGRAVRAGSHASLLEEDRNVRVFEYLSIFTESQKQQSRAIRTKDEGLTTDQRVQQVATRKKKFIDTVLDVMRDAAVDCTLHRTAHNHLEIDCARFKGAPGDPVRPILLQQSSMDQDVSGAARVTTLQVAEVKGKKYAYDSTRKILYDLDILRERGELVRVSLG